MAGGAAPCQRAGCDCLQCCHPLVRKGPAATAGLTSLMCVAAPCRRAGRGYLQCGRQRVWKGPAAPAGPTSLTCDVAPCPRAGCGYCQGCFRVWERGPAALQALYLLRSVQRRAIGPDVVASVLPSACAKVPAAPAGNIFLASDAESCHCAGGGRQLRRGSAAVPGHRAGCVDAQRCRQRMRAGPDGPAGFTAPYARCSTRTSRRRRSPTVLPSACGKSASSTSRAYISCERCSAMSSCRV